MLLKVRLVTRVVSLTSAGAGSIEPVMCKVAVLVPDPPQALPARRV